MASDIVLLSDDNPWKTTDPAEDLDHLLGFTEFTRGIFCASFELGGVKLMFINGFETLIDDCTNRADSSTCSSLIVVGIRFDSDEVAILSIVNISSEEGTTTILVLVCLDKYPGSSMMNNCELMLTKIIARNDLITYAKNFILE